MRSLQAPTIRIEAVLLLCVIAAGTIYAEIRLNVDKGHSSSTGDFSSLNKRIPVDVDFATGKISIQNVREDTVLTGALASSSPGSVKGQECFGRGNTICYHWKGIAEVRIDLVVTSQENDSPFSCVHVGWESFVADIPLRDCYSLEGAHWYGAAEKYEQVWPIEKASESTAMFASTDIYENLKGYGSVLDRYWLSSRGVAIRVSHDAPLHVSLNENSDGMLCFQSTYDNSYYPNEENNLQLLDYTICTHDNVRLVHDAIWREMGPDGGKPAGLPDERMFRSPIWSSWAKYKIFINDTVINAYADEILSNGFGNSQLEIDDGFSMKHGQLDFDPEKFPDMKDTVQKLHDKGFRVTLWVTPFANTDTDAYQEGKEKGYWVTKRGQDEGVVKWWNGLAGMLDVTNPEAVEWFVGRLEKLQQETGIDSYKFDAGEINYLVEDFETYIPLVNPCEYT
ncbi:uncharacterized family 31 glucosidase KIAA1161-like, partial [Acanthaster planci]|uniref:Uncharacterized family 31 glucosidase KIAA1161-like n=1 Tax=Acanthaster planci TaxID=133434 RepID=A0A8B7ZPM0_ACAPL